MRIFRWPQIDLGVFSQRLHVGVVLVGAASGDDHVRLDWDDPGGEHAIYIIPSHYSSSSNPSVDNPMASRPILMASARSVALSLASISFSTLSNLFSMSSSQASMSGFTQSFLPVISSYRRALRTNS